MDRQNQLSAMAKSLENYLKDAADGDVTNAANVRGTLQSIFVEIGASNQFSGLQDAMNAAINTLSGDSGANWGEESFWGAMTDPNVSNAELATDMNENFSPTPGSGVTNPSETLQTIVGGVDGIVTAVSSASSQQTTMAQQLQAMIQAEDKPMLGVVDPNSGMDMAVNKTTINHQTGN
jgi:hypothetical protein